MVLTQESQEVQESKESKEVQEVQEDNSSNPFSTQNLIGKIQKQSLNIYKLVRIGAALSNSRNLGTLLDTIIEEAMFFTNSEGGTIYLRTRDESKINFSVIRNNKLNVRLGSNGEITWPPIELYKADGSQNKEMVAAVCVLEDRVVNIPDVYYTKEFNFEGTKKFDSMNAYRSKSMLVIPMKDHDGDVIGAMQLINKLDGEEVVEFDSHDEEIATSLASQAAVSITNSMLIKDLEALLEAFLNSIAMALDEKSPYTGGHIKKMLNLSVMIAKAIDKDETVFSHKKFTENEIRQIHLAALMHDVGKITTPEHIVDKATKLETIFDRIELVKLKFEILKRDIKIELLENKISQEEYETILRRNEEYFELIRYANAGKEFTADETIAKINEIKNLKIELENIPTNILTDEEVKNLSIKKGTITEEERLKINDHAMVGYRMLQALPFPKKYKNIPKIAAGHHEKLNGKGYPLGLKGDEVCFETRILAVADIFEALTSSDRPYKKPLALSQAMKILYFMVKDGELDKNIVKFFYESGLYLEYATKELKPEQLDEIKDLPDIS